MIKLTVEQLKIKLFDLIREEGSLNQKANQILQPYQKRIQDLAQEKEALMRELLEAEKNSPKEDKKE